MEHHCIASFVVLATFPQKNKTLTDMTQVSVIVVISIIFESSVEKKYAPKGVVEVQTLPDTRAYEQYVNELFQSPFYTLTSKITVAASTLVPGT